MSFYNLSYYSTLIQRGIQNVRRAVGRKKMIAALPAHRYDSTGRMVHYGPEGEVLEDDSAFQITGVQYGQDGLSITAPTAHMHLSQQQT
jgi:hypothetical protein